MTDAPTTSTIADRLRPQLSPLLALALDTRTAEGLRKYGQTLDDNHKPDRAKTVHLLQEGLDLIQYAEWKRPGHPVIAALIPWLERSAAEVGDLTLDELLFKEGHSREVERPAQTSFSSVAELVTAARAGTLPAGFKVRISHHSVEAACDNQDDAFQGELKDQLPEVLLGLLLSHLGVPNEWT